MIPFEQLWLSRRWWALAGAGLVLFGVVLSQFNFSGDRASSLCFFRLATGIPCPGCGLTRSVSALAKRDLPEAVRFHPLGPFFATEALAVWVYWGISTFLRIPLPSVRVVNGFLLLQAVLLLVVWVVRLAG